MTDAATDDPFDTLSGNVRAPVGQTAVALVAVAVVGVIMNPGTVTNWILDLPVHPAVESALQMAEQWHMLCEDLGLTYVFTSVREWMQLMQEYGQ